MRLTPEPMAGLEKKRSLPRERSDPAASWPRPLRRLSPAARATLLAGLIVAAVAVVMRSETFYRYAFVFARLTMIKMLRFWDWTKLSQSECLISLPYDEEEGLTYEDCQKCANVTSHHYLQAINQVYFSSYLLRAMPAVVTDATSQWPALTLFDEKFLLEAFEKNKKLAEAKLVSCHARSNVIPNSANAKYILGRVVHGKLTSWYAFWENCHVEASRMMRKYYSRPYFLPLSTELQQSNWLFASRSFAHTEEVLVPLSNQMVWIAQIRGTTNVRLFPREPCDASCRDLNVTLKTGEILVYTDLWEATWLPPASDELSLSLATGGRFS